MTYLCAEVVHILSSDDEEDRAATSVVTSATQSTSDASSVLSTLMYRVGCPFCQFQIVSKV